MTRTWWFGGTIGVFVIVVGVWWLCVLDNRSRALPRGAEAPVTAAFGTSGAPNPAERSDEERSLPNIMEVIDLSQTFEPKPLDAEPIEEWVIAPSPEPASPRIMPYAAGSTRAGADGLISLFAGAAADGFRLEGFIGSPLRGGEETSEPPAAAAAYSDEGLDWLRGACVELFARVLPLAGSRLPAPAPQDE
jgi:hypothetical protein